MLASYRTACRWLKVPRRLSWPLSRTGVPSSSSEPNASISANGQSIGLRLDTSWRRAVEDARRASGGREALRHTRRARRRSASSVSSRHAGLDRVGRVVRRAAPSSWPPKPCMPRGARRRRLDLVAGLPAASSWNVSSIVSASSRVRSPRHDQLLGVELAERRPLADLAVHDRLGERRLVALVVAVAAVADMSMTTSLLELLAEVEGQLGDVDARLGVLAVDVEDRRLDHLGHVGAVGASSGRRRGWW